MAQHQLRLTDKPPHNALAELDKEAGHILDQTSRGVSIIIGPIGAPAGDIMSDTEGILYANIDLSACVEPKQIHDVVGYYNRFDIFKLKVDRSANRRIAFEMDTSVQATESTPGV